MRWFWQRREPVGAVAVTTAGGAGQLDVSRGRRHFVNLPYLLPKDVEEGNRLDFQHFLLKYVLRGNFVAPLRSPRAILDVGTGTGRWARDMARQFPQANVVAVDLTPPSIESIEAGPMPANYTFVPGNLFDGLPFADNSFDYVHMRLLYAGLPVDQWPVVIQELRRVAARGAWVELVEGYVVVDGGPATDRVQDWGIEANLRRGIDIRYGQNIGTLLQQAGFTQVRQQSYALPLGPWGGRLGIMVEKNLTAVFKGLSVPVVKMQIASAADYDAAMENMAAAFQTGHATFPYFVAIGQKN